VETRATAEELLPLVYEELRRIAASQIERERSGITLQTTALVHEAFLKLHGATGGTAIEWENEEHFVRAAAQAMQRILVDHARARKRAKRGGGHARQSIDQIERVLPAVELPDFLPELHTALERLACVEPTAAEVIQLRYFAGMTNAQSASALGISPRTADRYWAFARAWLYHELQKD
jgi:RNA polymerase sigma factor (TIGR02999 family)